MAETQEVNAAFAARISVLSDFNVGAATVLLDWLQYMHTEDVSGDMMNLFISNLPFTGEELYRFYAYDCNKQMESFHFQMVSIINRNLKKGSV